MIYNILVTIDVFIAAALIALVLMQQGKGSGMGAAFGAGSSSTVFGASGAGSFLTRATAILAALFFINSILLAYVASNRADDSSVLESPTAVEMLAPADDGLGVEVGDGVNVLNMEGKSQDEIIDIVRSEIDRMNQQEAPASGQAK
ncbi:MAG: preprotein translocase subunit SecG [Gammaproteobacteria bacterium]|jgi:preprotein translocase subunit SecG|nr:preprotein translocase subunit SecG [Gammaproteobacteria bacterium]|tara:strand:- start:13365 stop:13802 length:438 start_codon:yes stop_codon:yes gene_type:complete